MQIASRRNFDLDRVVDAALELVDERGGAALSIRAVAARLDVNPNAVYTYVDSRAALEFEVVERIMSTADIDTLLDADQPWDDRIIAFALSMREIFHAHPAAALLLTSTRPDGPQANRIGEGLLHALGDAGFGLEHAARSAHAILVQIIGSIGFDIAETSAATPLPTEEARIATRRTLLDDIEDAPLTTESADTIAAWISTDQFIWGLKALLHGLTLPSEGH